MKTILMNRLCTSFESCFCHFFRTIALLLMHERFPSVVCSDLLLLLASLECFFFIPFCGVRRDGCRMSLSAWPTFVPPPLMAPGIEGKDIRKDGSVGEWKLFMNFLKLHRY